MDINQARQALRRRWVLAGFLLLLTLAGTAALAARPGPYQATSQVVFLPSQQYSRPYGGNPYLSFGQALTLTADLIRREVMDPRTALSLSAQGVTGSYLVVDDLATPGPVLDITAVANSKSATEQTLQAVTREVGIKLGELQAGVKPYARISILTISYGLKPSLYISKKARPLVVVLGLGLVLSIAIPLALDAALPRRRASRQPQRRPVKGAVPEPVGARGSVSQAPHMRLRHLVPDLAARRKGAPQADPPHPASPPSRYPAAEPDRKWRGG
jgi:hypothetical protein